MKILTFLLIFILFASSLSYAGMRLRIEDNKEQIQIEKKYDRLSGIIILGFATYFFYNGLEMMKRDSTYEAGSLLLMLSSPLFFWGITLTF